MYVLNYEGGLCTGTECGGIDLSAAKRAPK